MNSYAEYLVSRKKNVFDYVIILLVIFAGVSATLCLAGFLMLQLYGMFAALAIAAVWFVVYSVICSRNIEYEYCVTENVLDVDIITAKKKRKRLVSIDLKNAEIIAPATHDYSQQYNKEGLNNKLDASMGENGILDFFVIYLDDDDRVSRLVFTPDKTVLDLIKRVNPSNTFFE